MNLDELKSRIPEYAKDVKINLGTSFSRDAFPGLSEVQHFGTLLASSIAVGATELKAVILESAANVLKEEDIRAAHAAAAIMAMNNIYYKSINLMGDAEVASMPAKLRMTVIGNPGVDKADFELYCLAVSAINGCGACLKAHAQELVKHGVGKDSLHSAIRIASIINSAQFVLSETN